jgi:hypothetical protein
MTNEPEIHHIEEGEPFIWDMFTNLFARVDCNSLYLWLRDLRDEHGYDTEVQVLPTGQVKVFPKTIIYADMLDEEEDEDEFQYTASVIDPDDGKRLLYAIPAKNDSEALRLAVEAHGTGLAEVTVENDAVIERTVWSLDHFETELEALKAISGIIADPAVKARTLEDLQ